MTDEKREAGLECSTCGGPVSGIADMHLSVTVCIDNLRARLRAVEAERDEAGQSNGVLVQRIVDVQRERDEAQRLLELARTARDKYHAEYVAMDEELDEAREALRPFVERACSILGADQLPEGGYSVVSVQVTVAAFRRAAAVLEKGGGKR